MPRHYWTCPCGTRNERTKQRCANHDCRRRRPKKRVPRHAQTLRDDSYQHYAEVNATIHGVTDEACGVCGKPRSQERRHDRDHDHVTGHPRGLACVYCNKHMPRGLTLEMARLVVAYMERVAAHYNGAPVDPHLPEAYPSMAVLQKEARTGVREFVKP